MASNKSIYNYFYTKLDPSTYKCRCGKVRKQAAGTGYENLVSNLWTSHKDARELFDSLIEKIGKLHPAVHYLDNTENSICRYVAFEIAVITALNQLPLTAEQEDLLHVFNPSM